VLEGPFKDEGQVKGTSLHPPSPALGINIYQPEADIVNSTQNVVQEGRAPRGSAWRQRKPRSETRKDQDPIKFIVSQKPK
jgi:hypothetical protein